MASEPEIESFFEHWIGEFSRAVEMFTGESPGLTYARLPVLTSSLDDTARREIEESRLTGRLWWKQLVEGGTGDASSFASWTGAPLDCWTELGGAVDEKSDPRRTYLDMLDQANKGTAAVLSAGFPHPLRCGDGLEDALASLAALEVAEVNVVFRGKELPTLLLAIEPSAARVLRLSGTAEEPPAASNAAANRQLPSAPADRPSGYPIGHLLDQPLVQSVMMNRLMELRLPVSVLLGHTSISIREVLKLTPGSVIELDRKIGDYVEIVVHGTVVARGEIVSVGGNYGVRIKEVISREDRLALRHAA
jgi:flagellar motor switch protein FliN/FliY